MDLPTPIKSNRLEQCLLDYPDKDYIVNGCKNGFTLHFEGPQCATHAKNSKTTQLFESQIDTKLKEELSLGRISGPYSKPPLTNFKVSPLSARAKKENPDKVRLLHNLSYPYDITAVNTNILRRFATVSYQTIGDAITIINKLGRGCFLAKSDISQAFRLLPLRPNEYNLTGFIWKNNYYFDRCLVMGSSSSCYIFEKFSNSLQFILGKKCQIKYIVKVIDDFLILEKSEPEASKSLSKFTNLMGHLGVPLADHKTVFPTTKLEFLGITLDTKTMTAHIPEEKIANYVNSIDLALQSTYCTLKDLQSLTGKLQHTEQIGVRCL